MRPYLWVLFAIAAWGAERRHILSGPSPLTDASPAPAATIAAKFLRDRGIGPEGLPGVYLFKEYKSAGNGVTHLIYKQRFDGIEVHNAEFTVNIDSLGRILNAGGILYNRPSSGLPADAAARPAGDVDLVWYAWRGNLRPAWIGVVNGEGADVFERITDYASGQVLEQQNLTLYQNPRGLVFERGSPRPNPTPGVVNTDPPWVERTLQPFSGSPAASPRGWVIGNATVGNNAVAGPNPLAIRFVNPSSPVAPGGDFSFPLQFGPGAPPVYQFGDAAAVNLFYWVNRAHDLFHEIGFDETSGNFQQDNFGRGGVGGDPMHAYAHFGSAAPGGVQLNNAFFTTPRRDDGNRAMIAMYLGSQAGEYTDGSYDADVIIHEYTHGVSSRLARQVYSTFQGASMGEAWSDFFALEFLLPEGAPVDGIYGAAEYLFNAFGRGLRTRPVSTRLDVNPLTYNDLGKVIYFPEVHADGEIWVQALWDTRANLIQQFGEREGRNRVRRLVIDGMKLSPPASSMVDMRDAILLADRVNYKGESQRQIWAAFAKRGLGVLAQSVNGNSTWISASFEVPGSKPQIGFYGGDSIVQGEPLRIVLHDNDLTDAVANLEVVSSAGDREPVQLQRTGMVYLGTLPVATVTSPARDARISLSIGDTITARYRDVEVSTTPRLPYLLFTAANLSARPVETDIGLRSAGFDQRRVNLPFNFTFFGETFGSMWVFSDGLITFDSPQTGFCRDSVDLAKLKGIAPMWGPMRTSGFAQQGEGVYTSTTGDSFTVRWAGETTPLIGAGSPVNFSATLFSDGRIQFQYGSGNKALSGGVQFTSCSGTAMVTGISNGHEVYTHMSFLHTGFGDLENAQSVQYLPPSGATSFPEGLIDTPAAGAELRGLLQVSGVVFDRGTSVSRADILVDGRLVGRGTLGPRPQSCVDERITTCNTVTATLDLTALEIGPGAHTIQFRALNARGGVSPIPAEPVRFTLLEGQDYPVIGAVEGVAEGAEVRGVIRLTGWAGSIGVRVTAVDVMVDGLTVGRATYGFPRPDICDTIRPLPLGCPAVGFTFNWNSDIASIPLAGGPHALQIRALDQSGRYTLIPETPITVNVRNGQNRFPVGVMATPAQGDRVSGNMQVWGWGWDPDGRVVGATLVIDGETRATVRYGDPRPEQCADLAEVTRCPNIGFAAEFDTRQLPNGPHLVGVRLFDDRGASAIVAGPNRNGVNIFVDNK